MSVFFDSRKIRRLPDRDGLWLKIPATLVRFLNLAEGGRVWWECRSADMGAEATIYRGDPSGLEGE